MNWSLQTSMVSLLPLSEVEDSFMKNFFTQLRGICSTVLHQMPLLGGPGKNIEVGVISLCTTNENGELGPVKVEILGALDSSSKIVRLRAFEPMAAEDKNYKKYFAMLFEPLLAWVDKQSTLCVDITIHTKTLNKMGFKSINQSKTAENMYCNPNIKNYLRLYVPRMLHATLSYLSIEIIQQFLDELVWREKYGTTPSDTFENIISHISEQTHSMSFV